MKSEPALDRYRELFENAADAMYVHDLTGRFILINKSAERLSGYSQDEILQMSVLDIVPQNYLQAIKDSLKSLDEHTAAVRDIEIATKHRNRVPVEVSCRFIYEAGVPVGVHGIVRDTTSRERADETPQKSEEQLQQSQKLEAIGQLAGGVAHDFNNLLTAILGYAELSLLRIHPDNPAVRNLEQIQKAAARGALLTRQLLAFSRKQILEPRVFDLNHAVKDMYDMLSRLIGENINLAISLASNLGTIKADPSQIEQIIMNLVVNARDAMPNGGDLIIETANVVLDEVYARLRPPFEPGEYVLLCISDTGVGMDAETQARIFEPFFTTKQHGEGTGLGLSTVYGIVKQSGGYIWVDSQLGGGTVFRVYLPRVASPITFRRAVPDPISVGGTETVLLVEDDTEVRAVSREILNSAGYRTITPNDVDEAVRVCQEYGEEIHLLLTDVVMPKLSGREFIDKVLASRPDVKVLFMSGYTNDEFIKHSVEDSTMSLIHKPFSPDELLKRVRQILDAKQNT